MNRGMTVRGGMTITSSFRYVLAAKRYRGGMTVKQFVIPQRDLLLADEIPRMNRGMTVRGGMTITSSFRYVLAAKRYRGSMTVK